MSLGIDKSQGVVYEGESSWGLRPIFPAPHLFDMQIADTPPEAVKKLIDASNNIFKKLLFREDGFDPISMVRRGRVYEPEQQGQPQDRVVPLLNAAEATYNNQMQGGVRKSLYTFQRYAVSIRVPSVHRYAAIGSETAYSLWQVVSIDRMYMEEELLMLRPVYSMGALPDLDLSEVSEPWKSQLEGTVRKVVDAMKLANADSIIELCRHAASAALFAHFHKDIQELHKTDLGKLAERAGKDDKRIVENCGKVIANLHSRIKPNIQVQHGCRIVSDRDAELAICCLSCILSDLKFTNEK
jgi:hypothetical protein